MIRVIILACVVMAVFARTASADPGDLGPKAPMAEPSGGYVGKLKLSPDHAPVGGSVLAQGFGFAANADIELVWRTVEGRWKVANGEYHGREYAPQAYRMAHLKTDATGAFSAEFTTPEDFGYAHDIVVQQGERLLTQANFNLDMTWSITPENGPVGSPITIDIKGIGWRELENSWDLAYDNQFTGWISAVTTHGSARLTIPATGALGRHVIKLIHGEFTFPYLNPQQNPRPDRPRFEASFNLTPGSPVLPRPIDEQNSHRPRDLLAQGSLRVEPPFAPVGAPLLARASGLKPGLTYHLGFDTMSGNRVGGGGGFGDTSRPIAEAIADSTGAIAFHFNAPDDLGGPHRVSIDENETRVDGVFNIVASAFPLPVESAPPGAPFSIHLKGVGWTETANIHTIVVDNSYIGYACGFNSQGDVEVFLNVAGAPGWHFIDVYPAIYKGQETRPNNFRIPQLTFERDHPGEDLPAFHFAFEVTAGETSAASR